MSRLWDTPEFWARSEADELLRDYPNTEVGVLAASLGRMRGDVEGDPEFARDIVAELTKRAAAGVRFWPEPAGLAALEREVRAMLGSPVDDDVPHEAYWWQRM